MDTKKPAKAGFKNAIQTKQRNRIILDVARLSPVVAEAPAVAVH